MATPDELLAVACGQHQRGALAEAERLYRQVLHQRPGLPAARLNLGHLLLQQQRVDEAEQCLAPLAAEFPGWAEAHFNLGAAQEAAGRLADATESYRAALGCRAEFPEALVNLGQVLAWQNQLPEAEQALRRALAQRPDFLPALLNLGDVLTRRGELPAAVEVLRRAVERAPQWHEAWLNLGAALARQGTWEEAERIFRAGVARSPADAEAHYNLATVLQSQGQMAAAISVYEAALRLNPEHAQAHYNRALCWLSQGRWELGWPEYEWRWRTGDVLVRSFPRPRWDGRDPAGKTILVHAEQGLGDTIQFVRYAGRLQALGARVVLDCPEVLHPLLRSASGFDELVVPGTAGDYDLTCPLMSVPGLLGETLAGMVRAGPYLRAERQRVAVWQSRLEAAAAGSFRVGIAWQGSRRYAGDRFRSVPLAQFAPLAAVPGVRLISLQKGEGAAQVGELAGRFEVLDWSREIDEEGAFLDTAALMEAVDLVVTSDTATAHLAGALGVGAWIVLGQVPDWRWLLSGEDCPWYSGVRLFRQRTMGDWTGVVGEVAAALRRASASAAAAERPTIVKPEGAR